MSLRNSTDEVAEFAYPRTNSLALIIAGLAWIGYLITQSGAVMLGINSVHGCLLRLGAAMLFALGTILICVAFATLLPAQPLFRPRSTSLRSYFTSVV